MFSFNKEIDINGFLLSDDSSVYIIAEAGVNHDGKISKAFELVDIAVAANANAVKFQTFITENLILENVEKAPYQIIQTGLEKNQFEMLKELELSIDEFKELNSYCKSKKIDFLTTPFDEISLDLLDSLDLPAYKVASTDLTNIPFLRKIALKQKPIILSTGMSYLSEVEIALSELNRYNTNVILLHCTANYPVTKSEVNLNILSNYKTKFNLLVGYSDHSEGIGVSPYAVAMGAKVIEKHFTIDKTAVGPDHKASLSPDELKYFVEEIRNVETYLGTSIKIPSISELKTRASLQKALVAQCDIKQGDDFSEENLIAKRTGGKGISPIYYNTLLGKKSPRNFKKNEIIELE